MAKDNLAQPDPIAIFPAGQHRNLGLPCERSIMASTQATHIGTQLDEHHSPETNGRMSVCRRCGAQTNDPTGLHHSPFESQLTRSTNWLAAQSRLVDIERARQSRVR